MAKVLKKVVAVIGVIASIAAVIPGPHQPIAALIAVGASVAATALTILVPPKPPPVLGSQTQFRLDPQAGIPYVVGRTMVGGNSVHTDTWGTDNEYNGHVIVWSGAGPCEAFEQFQADGVNINFSGTNAVGGFSGWMSLKTQLGVNPSPALTSPIAGFPGLGASFKLSGYLAGLWITKFDKKGKKFSGGEPRPSAIVRGVKVYDPRLDSTYPGGSGAHRALDETTYTYSENPWLHALTWALGRYGNGKRVIGCGVGIDGINVASFVDAANVADANNWKIGGQVNSIDNKWDVLKMMCQAGGGQPIRNGAQLSAFCDAPRVSVATITEKSIVGKCSVAATQFRRDRVNGIVPIYRSEAHGWEQVAADPVRYASLVTEDGGRRTAETEFVLVQQLKQAAELAGYEILNSREFGPIDLSLSIEWMGIEPGDMVVLDMPILGLVNQPALCLTRGIDPLTGVVSISFRSETATKHGIALGTSTTIAASPSLVPPDASIVNAPLIASWALSSSVLTGTDGTVVPILKVTGATDNPNASHVVFEYRLAGAADWIMHSTQDAGITVQDMSGLKTASSYEVAVSYVVRGVLGDRRVLGPVSTLEFVSGDAAALAGEDAAAILASLATARASATFVSPTAPSLAESVVGNTWLNDATGELFDRIDATGLSLGGDIISLGGDTPYLAWTSSANQPLIAAYDQAAFANAQAIIGIALAVEAQATADGKIRTFFQTTAPVAEGVGDIWFDTDDGNKQYRWSGSAWVAAQDTAIGNAITAAAGAQATADGKVTTFIQETAPVAEAVGDLWFKASTGELRRWDGASWGAALVDLTQVAQVTVNMSPDKTVAADYLGVVSAPNLAALVWTPSVIKGGTTIKTADTTTYALSGTYGGTWAVDNVIGSAEKGNVTITAITAAIAGGILTVSVNGVALPSLPFKVEKDPAPIPPAAAGTDSEAWASGDFISLSSSSYVAISTVKTLALASGQTLYGNFDLTFEISGSGGTTSRNLTSKLQYSVAGAGSWNDFAAGVTGISAIKFSNGDSEPGAVTVTQSKSGLGAGNWDVRLVGQLNGTGRTVVISGTGLVEAKV